MTEQLLMSQILKLIMVTKYFTIVALKQQMIETETSNTAYNASNISYVHTRKVNNQPSVKRAGKNVKSYNE